MQFGGFEQLNNGQGPRARGFRAWTALSVRGMVISTGHWSLGAFGGGSRLGELSGIELIVWVNSIVIHQHHV